VSTLELVGIEKGFGTTPIVRGVDLQCAAGEFLILVGPSGCGKSTLLRLIAGLEDPDRGDVKIGGERVNDRAPKDRDIAMVFQSYALYPHMTVAENMGFALALRKMAKADIDRQVRETAEALGIAHLLERKPSQLSGGQRQRVAMGRAIVRKPKIFLFDEPLSNLDAHLRGQMRVELKKLHQRLRTTMVYVTHDQIEAMTLADRIVVLDQGKVQQLGTPAAVFDTPATTFVAKFIGTPSINLLPMSARSDGALEGPHGATATPGRTVPAAVEVGVRPHALGLLKPEHALRLKARVDVVEPLGWEAHVHLQCGDIALTSLMTMAEAQKLAVGAEVELGAVVGELHVFDKGTGRRV